MMIQESPLRKCHEEYALARSRRGTDDQTAADRPGAARGSREGNLVVEYLQYGPLGVPGAPAVAIAATFGEFEAEYAALRRAAGILDSPHRGLLMVRGKDRLDFLNRMVTQDLTGMAAGTARGSFLLNRKGRIEGDLLLVEMGEHLLVESDLYQVDAIRKALEEHVFSEDVSIDNVSGEHHQIAVHGPRAMEVLQAACGDASMAIAPFEAGVVSIAGVEVVVARRDQVGDVGLCLIMAREKAEVVWEALVGADAGSQDRGVPGRPVGWYAFNTARIEAGTPLFNLDFGTMNLPHETGLLSERVSFKKGCYMGQEIVARMGSRGQTRQVLRGLRPPGHAVPVTGEAVFAKTETNDAGEDVVGTGDQVGIVTSSTPAPMLGFAPIAFAMLKTAAAGIGSTVLAYAEGEIVEAVVQDLTFWRRTEADG